MFARLSALVLGHRRAVLWVAVLLALVGGASSATLFDDVKGGGFTNPGAESGQAADVLAERFGQQDPNVVLLVHAPGGVDEPAARAAGSALAERLAAEDGVSGVLSYWTAGGGAGPLRSADGERALILATVAGDETEAGRRLAALRPDYEGNADGLEVAVGGPAMINHEVGELSERDVIKGETIAFPVMLVVLVLIFGSLVAASLPLVTGLITILVSLGLLWAMAQLTDVSVLAVNVVTLLGLGLAVDYSLLMVNRYREELRAGQDSATAIRVMMGSAGRTVLFSAVTVAVTLAGLAWFPLLALRSIAYSGIAVAVLTALTTLTVLPALLAVLGPRFESGRVLRRRATARQEQEQDAENGFWHRLASLVMRRPVPFATLGTLFLLLLGLPFLSLNMGALDERALPTSSAGRQVAEVMRAEFDSGEAGAVRIVLPEGAPEADLATYAAGLSAHPDAARVDAPTGSYAQGTQVAEAGPQHAALTAADGSGAAALSVVPAPGEQTRAEQLVRDIRSGAAAEAPSAILVGGQAAVALDGIAAITDRLPVAALTLGLAMVVLLFLLTGSVLLPFIAMLLSALGLTATFGALVWGFQDGHLAGLLGFTATGTINGTVPVLLFAVAFGLGMDYQVFLLSRIREEYERGGDPRAAVALGLERIGRIVTAAAAVLSIVFLAFLISDISFMKAMGIGLPLAVLMDATLIRGALLPAAMRLGGRAIWWLPAPLRRVHDRYGLHDADPAGPPAARPAEPARSGRAS
ncbi:MULTISPECIES: MMPL family transporter [Streptomyces]|uniref:Putative drug exporter of the RND superfamily n=1 Tax=Streptomyces harbinensis TaxID=1176198 RepID=A0A1I6UT82_9ACTN|nr:MULTISPECIES: MMPL family transporter [Streptomyces]SFT04655.1 putative drug exporter of the RND superfamily [Streptomyces harbinensis]